MNIAGYLVTIGFFLYILLFPFANEEFILKGAFLLLFVEGLSVQVSAMMPFYRKGGKFDITGGKLHIAGLFILGFYTLMVLGASIALGNPVVAVYFAFSTHIKYLSTKKRRVAFAYASIAVYFFSLIALGLLGEVLADLFPLPAEILANNEGGGDLADKPQLPLLWAIMYFSALMFVDVLMSVKPTKRKQVIKILFLFFTLLMIFSVAIIGYRNAQDTTEVYTNYGSKYELVYDTEHVEIDYGEPFERGNQYGPNFRIKTGGNISVGVWPNLEGLLNPDEWLDDYYAEYGGWRGSFDQIDGEPNRLRGILDDACYIEWFVVAEGDLIYTLATEICDESRKESIGVFREMVSSFKVNI